MGNRFRCYLALISLWFSAHSDADPFARAVGELSDERKADWIAPPADLRRDAGLYLFRKTFELEEVPDSFVVHVTADPRYKFYVNGNLAAVGPAAGDLLEWQYETLDIAAELRLGRNLLAVEVWDAGADAGVRQHAIRTAMLLEAPDGADGPTRSGANWKVSRSAGWEALPMDSQTVGGGYIAGATERLDATRHPWGWNADAGFDDGAWAPAVSIGKGSHGKLDTWLGTPWVLRSRSIPMLEIELADAGEVRAVWRDGEAEPADVAWPIVVEPSQSIRVLLDRRVIGLGFPSLDVSGGEGSRIRLRYQEALFRPEGGKGHRDEIAGKVMKGYYDEFLPDGAANRIYQPAWVRTYRYAELTAEASDQPLTLHGLSFRRASYPFERRGSFGASDSSLAEILEASWNTLETCALETYMDCPYYEQVQYVGDTRIQALISLYMTGDDRLMRNAIMQFHRSRQPDGLTASSAPARYRGSPQVIPPFSLLYASMVHDFYMHRDDPDFIEPLLPGIAYTLEWFLQRLDERDLLGPLPYWNHTDGGAQGFRHGSPPGASTGGSIQISLLLVAALDEAATLFDAFDREREGRRFREIASRIRDAARRYGYDEKRGLFAETPEKRVFSQHTNAYAILTGTVDDEKREALAQRLVSDPELIQATLYFQFYVFQALRSAGMGDLILPELERWRVMLAAGLTTFPEHGVESRSDAHAWAAHPLYHLLATTAGIVPAAPGFRRVAVRPALGDLTWLESSVCHPDGMIELKMERIGMEAVTATVTLPDGIEGEFEWKGAVFDLRGGLQSFSLE